MHCQWGEAGLVSPGSCVCVGPHLTFSDTLPTEALEDLVSTRWVWKSRLPTQILQADWKVRPQFFSCGMWLEQSSNCLKVFYLEGLFLFCSGGLFFLFSCSRGLLSTSIGISELSPSPALSLGHTSKKENLGNSSVMSFLRSQIWADLVSSLFLSESSYVCFIHNVLCF